MPTPQDTFRNAANSPAARQAAENAKSTAEDFGEAAGRVSAKAQDMAVEGYDQAHAAAQRNPLMAVGIALGIGFLFGALSTARR